MAHDVKRNEKGHYLPGSSGNISGGHRPDPQVNQIYKAATAKAARRVVEALDARYPDGKNVMLPDHETRLKAAQIIHTRLYGAPKSEVQIDSRVSGTIIVGAGDLSVLSNEELCALETAATKLLLTAGRTAEDDPEDGDSED